MTLEFKASQVMFMLDIMREDKARWCKIGNDPDVTAEYDDIIQKLSSALDDYNGTRKAINSLMNATNPENNKP